MQTIELTETPPLNRWRIFSCLTAVLMLSLSSWAKMCRVYYARTSNWSSVAVGGGTTPQTVNFTLPAGIPSGNYLLTVTGAGITSPPFTLAVP